MRVTITGGPGPMPPFRLGHGDMAEIVAGGQRAIPRRALDAGHTFRRPDLDAALA
jgi:NAD dependent epimerase/dehydratase family enzyme